MRSTFDVIVLGHGPVACAATSECARLGFEALVVRPEPTAESIAGLPPRFRPAIASAILGESESTTRRAGLEQALEQRIRGYLESIQAPIERAGVRVVSGATTFETAQTIVVDGARHEARKGILIASGTRPRRPRRFVHDGRVVCDTEEIFGSLFRMRRVAVVGACDEGCELASIFAALGAEVVLVDRRKGLLRSVDRDVLAVLHAELRRMGVEIALGEEIRSLSTIDHANEPHAILELSSGRRERFDRVVVCAGRLPNTEGFGLDLLEIDTDPQGFVMVDERGRTSHPSIYAAGDVTAGAPSELGAHLHLARLAVHEIAGIEAIASEYMPRILYTVPEIATVGLTEEACERLGYPVVAGTARYGKGWSADHTADTGLLKLVAASRDQPVLGIHAIGRGARELIHLGVDLLRTRASLEVVRDQIFLSPSLSEAYGIAAERALSQASHNHHSLFTRIDYH